MRFVSDTELATWADMWQYATCWDLPKAAKDWPQINFVIYHSAMRPLLELPDRELGACFANTCVTHPKLAAANTWRRADCLAICATAISRRPALRHPRRRRCPGTRCSS